VHQTQDDLDEGRFWICQAVASKKRRIIAHRDAAEEPHGSPEHSLGETVANISLGQAVRASDECPDILALTQTAIVACSLR
jgi:hypothetical protein